jgi:hypothetical protein
MKVKRIERGWAGHFICADRCLFRRNTLLQFGKKKVVVSTVGNMLLENKKLAEEIGYDRYYETMSFMADDSVYSDADVSNQVYPSMDIKWSISKKEMEAKEEQIDNIANEMHENYVKAIENMLINGEI